MPQTPFHPPLCPWPVRPADVPKPVTTVNNQKPDEHGNVNVNVPGGDVKHSDFTDMQPGGKMDLDTVNEKVDTLIRKLKGTASLAFALLSLSSFAALGPTTRFGAVHPDTVLREVVEAGLGGGISLDTNAVRDVVNASFAGGTNAVNGVVAAVGSTSNSWNAAAETVGSMSNSWNRTGSDATNYTDSATNALRLCDGAARSLPKYLHLYEADDSYPEAAQEYYRSRGNGKVDGGCSAVRSGGYLYRNFDFPFDDRAEFVVKMSAGAGRFASVGVAQVGTNLTERMVTSGKPSKWYESLPGATVDGINENGVVVEINVVDTPVTGWHTNATDKAIHPLAAPRWVLDHATNAQHGAEYIAANIRFPKGWEQNFHYMVADAEKTYIVENGTATDGDEYREPDEPVTMTNFQLSKFPWDGMGMERFGLLLGSASITNAWYTNAYRRETNPPWASDLAEVIAYTNAIFDAWAAHDKEYFRGKTNNDIPWWQTVHTSIYDMTNRTLRIAVQETDDWYVFAVPVSSGIKVETDPTVPAWAKEPNPPQGMPATGLVWSATAGKVKTADGAKTIGADDVGAYGKANGVIITNDYNGGFMIDRQSGNTTLKYQCDGTSIDMEELNGGEYQSRMSMNTSTIDFFKYQNPTDDPWEYTSFLEISDFGFMSVNLLYPEYTMNLMFPSGKNGVIAVEDWSSLSAMLTDAETNSPAPANGPLMAKRLGAGGTSPKDVICDQLSRIAKPGIEKVVRNTGFQFIRSKDASFYRTGKPGQLGTGWAYTAVDGTPNLRYAAYVPELGASVRVEGAHGPDPVADRFGGTFAYDDLDWSVTSLSQPASENGKYDVVDMSCSFTNGLPVHVTLHRNAMSPASTIASVSTDYATMEFSDRSDPDNEVWHYCHSFTASGTSVTYVDNWNDSHGNYDTTYYTMNVSLVPHDASDYMLVSFGGTAFTTDENKGDSVSVLTERTGRPGEAGSGWGYKVYEFQTDRRSWNVKVPTLNASGASTDYTTVTEGMPNAIPVYRDPFAAVDAATACTMSDREVVSTDGKYSTDACSNATYTASVTLLGKKLSLEVSGVSVDGRPPVVKVVPTSQWAAIPYIPPTGQGSGAGMVQAYGAVAVNVQSSRRATKSIVIKDSYNKDVTVSSWQTVYGGVMMTVPVDPATGNVITETQGGSVKIPVGWEITRSLTAHATYVDSHGYSRTYDANGTARPSGTNYVTVSASPALSQFSVEGYELVNDKNKFEITDEVTGAKMVIRLRDGSLYLDPKED